MTCRDVGGAARAMLVTGVLGVVYGAASDCVWCLDLSQAGRLARIRLGDGDETVGQALRRMAVALRPAAMPASAEAAFADEDIGDDPIRAFAAAPLLVVGADGLSPEALPALVRERLGFADQRPLIFVLMAESGEVLVASVPGGCDRAKLSAMQTRLARLTAQLDREDRPLWQLTVLSDDEQRALIQDLNRTRRPYPAGESVGQLFRAAASRDPTAVAARFRSQTLTYEELLVRASRVAGSLRAIGVQPGETVGVLGDRSLDALTAIVGVTLAGGVYVPLSPQWPAARRRQIHRSAGLSAMIGCADAGGGADGVDGDPAGFTLTLADAAASGPVFEGHDGRCGTDRLYVLFTSGSTGEPKGVEVPHRGVTRLVFDRQLHPFSPGLGVMHAAPLSFDASTKEVWLPLLNGGMVSGFDKEEVLTADAFRAARRTRQVDVAFFTAALFETLLDQDPQTLTAIDRLHVGGEALQPAVMARALAVPGMGTLINSYGPTETTVYAVTHVLRPEDTTSDVVPIGRPIANTTAYVLDRHRRPVPPEAVGELYLGGDGVALGYLGDDELTAARFVPDRLSGEAGRLYRTGDRARIRPDGLIECLGRIDDQIKIRGHRIEPGEIQAALQALAGVDRAVVRVHEPVRGDRRLIAWIKPTPTTPGIANGTDDPAFVAAVERQLRERLPDYMIPSWFIPVAALPRGAHGKVDSAALPMPTVGPAGAIAIDHADPLPGVVALFQRALVNATITPDSGFLTSGGDSLLAVRLAQEVRRLCGVGPPIGLFFEPETPRAIADYLRVALWSRAGAAPDRSAVESPSVMRF